MNSPAIRPLRAAAAILLASAAAAPAPAEDAKANPLRGPDIPSLVAKAAEMKAKDVPGLVAALADLAADRKDRGTDLDFAIEFAVRETDRGLRLLALDAARKIDRKGAAERLRKRLAEKDVVRVALAAEALGHLGSAEDVPPLLETMKGPSEIAACAAATSLARLASGKDTDEIALAGVMHAEDHVTYHAAWAVQDIVKKPKAAVAKFEKLASKKDYSIRATATVALLQDKLAEPHVWGDSLAEARKLLLAAPASVPVKGTVPDSAKAVEAALVWLREKMPSHELLLRAAVKQINVPGPTGETRPDAMTESIDVSLQDAAKEPRTIAYFLHRAAVVVFQKRIGEPSFGHRGWEPGIFDSYDVCVVAKLYDAGPGGLTRERFVRQILGNRPWGGI
jgi:hypothetical protein